MKFSNIDSAKDINWGMTSTDYGKFRPGYPEEFYNMLATTGVGTPGQSMLDLGCGTGVLARAFAKRGVSVTGIDVSPEQIAVAKTLATQDDLSIKFEVMPVEDIEYPPQSFDVISAGQSWLYFDAEIALRKVLELLAPNGKLVLTYLVWLPEKDRIASASEQLALRFNPDWSGAGEKGLSIETFSWPPETLTLLDYHVMERPIRFTRDTWRGRFRACRGVGASLSKFKTKEFDFEHEILLKSIAEEEFDVLHQISAFVFSR